MRFFLAKHGTSKHVDSIDKYRYLSFVKNTWSNKSVKLTCILPSMDARYQFKS